MNNPDTDTIFQGLTDALKAIPENCSLLKKANRKAVTDAYERLVRLQVVNKLPANDVRLLAAHEEIERRWGAGTLRNIKKDAWKPYR